MYQTQDLRAFHDGIRNTIHHETCGVHMFKVCNVNSVPEILPEAFHDRTTSPSSLLLPSSVWNPLTYIVHSC